MAKQKLTKLQQEYKKQIQRLQKAQRKYEKRGYVYKENSIPQMPQRVTQKALQKIKQTKPTDIIRKSVLYVEKDSKRITPKQYQKETRERRKIEKQLQKDYEAYLQQAEIETKQTTPQAASLDDYYMSIILNFYDGIRAYPTVISDAIIHNLETMRKMSGNEALADALNKAPKDLHEFINDIHYDSGSAVARYTAQILDYLPLSEETKVTIADTMESIGMLDGNDYE